MATFSSMAALKRAIQQEAKAAMKEAQTKMLKKTKEETQGYYSQGNPTIYDVPEHLEILPRLLHCKDLGIFFLSKFI